MYLPKGKTRKTEDQTMWKEGTIGVKNSEGRMEAIHYWCKHFDESSDWGIEGGRISKLMLKQGNKVVYNFDRGEDVKPQTAEAKTALAILLHEYN